MNEVRFLSGSLLLNNVYSAREIVTRVLIMMTTVPASRLLNFQVFEAGATEEG